MAEQIFALRERTHFVKRLEIDILHRTRSRGNLLDAPHAQEIDIGTVLVHLHGTVAYVRHFQFGLFFHQILDPQGHLAIVRGHVIELVPVGAEQHVTQVVRHIGQAQGPVIQIIEVEFQGFHLGFLAIGTVLLGLFLGFFFLLGFLAVLFSGRQKLAFLLVHQELLVSFLVKEHDIDISFGTP